MRYFRIASGAVAPAASIALIVVAVRTGGQSRPRMNQTLSPQERAEFLVKQMTLEEKILKIHMINIPDHPREVAANERLGFPALKVTNGAVGAGPGDSPPIGDGAAVRLGARGLLGPEPGRDLWTIDGQRGGRAWGGCAQGARPENHSGPP